MTRILEGCVEQVLAENGAKAGDLFGDEFGNRWVVHDDRDGLKLEHTENASAWIPYWTASIIKLPGLARIED